MNNRRITSRKREQLERIYRTDSDFDDFEFEGDEDLEPYVGAPRTRGYRNYDRQDRNRERERDYYRRESSNGSNERRESEPKWYSCRPVLIGCALTCLITVGMTKGDQLGPWLSSTAQSTTAQVTGFFTPTGPQQPMMISAPRTAPVRASNQFTRIPGLSASRSTITGFTDAESMSAAYYWTFTLTNSGQAQQEAIMRIAVPPGATISRATLWVNGIAQEAAFSTTAQVNRAYEWVRNGRQIIRPVMMHDPLVITQESPGHILVKAAPVEAGGQELKLRIGFTAPLRPNTGKGSLQLPHIEESNFNISNLQDVHLESVSSVTANESAVTSVDNPAGGFLLRGNIRPEELGSLKVDVDLQGATKLFATRATHSAPGNYILARVNDTSTNGQTSISLRKASTLPKTYRLIRSEAAAARLSALWAHAEIESLVRRGETWQADELARVHRIVSSISGATVLELDSDYASMGLNRDLYATSGIGRSAGATAGGSGTGDGAQSPSFEEKSLDRATFQQSAPSAAAPMPSAPRTKSIQRRFASSMSPQPAAPIMMPSPSPVPTPMPMPAPKPSPSAQVARPLRASSIAPSTRSRAIPAPTAESDVNIVFSDTTPGATPTNILQHSTEQNSGLLAVGGIVALLAAGFLLLKGKGRTLWARVIKPTTKAQS